MMYPTLYAYYRLSDDTIAQLVGEFRGRLSFRDPATGREWEQERAPFVADLNSKIVEQVTPVFEPVDETRA